MLMRAYARAKAAGDAAARKLPAGVRSSAGHALDAESRAKFESRFSHDFGQVRVHADAAADRSAKQHGALAYTFGRDIVFASGQYRPHTAAGDHLLAHELGHVIEQQRAGAPSIQRQVAPAAQPASAQADIERFNAGAPYFKFNFRTGNGLFDAIYMPGKFYVLVRVGFNFWPMRKDLRPDDKRPAWEESEIQPWKDLYLTEVAKKWTSANILLHCAEPGWESLEAQVIVIFEDIKRVRERMSFIDPGEFAPHWLIHVKKVSPDTPARGVTHPVDEKQMLGEVEIDSQGLQWWRTKGHYQRAAIHESGHMLGLADMYTEPDNPALQKSFQKRAKKELGVEPPIKNDSRIMSVGEKITPQDAVSFVEAIRATTRKKWSILPPQP